MATTQINRVEKRPVTEITELQAAVAELARKFERLSTRGRSNARTRAFSRSTCNNNNNHASQPSSNECWYHRKYGVYARKCRSPCSRKLEKEFAGNSSTQKK